MFMENLFLMGKIVQISEIVLENCNLVGLGEKFGRSVNNFGRSGTILKDLGKN